MTDSAFVKFLFIFR